MPITTEPKGSKPPIANVAKVSITYANTLDAKLTAANVFYVKSAGITAALASTGINTFIGSFESAWKTRMLPFIAPQGKLIGVKFATVDGNGLQGFGVFSDVGTAGSGALPPQCAIAITWLGQGVTWRGGRPRTYLPNVPSGNVGGSVASLVSGIALSMANAAVGFMNDIAALTIAGSSVALGTVSYYSRGAFRTPPLWVPYVGAVVHDRLDSQRRRSGKERLYGVD